MHRTTDNASWIDGSGQSTGHRRGARAAWGHPRSRKATAMSITQQYLLDLHRTRAHGTPHPPAPGRHD
ncbi:hypothetical protein ACFY7X_36155, partial [Streptomyces althioticus]